jgi:catalase
MWEFLSLHPESLHMVTMLFSDRGTPASYRHMHAFGGHTFSLVNARNERVWVKFHLRTRQGIKNNTAPDAQRLAGADPDHATRDLQEAIERQEFPRWDLHIQVMTDAQAARHPENPFDVTKVWPHADYPLIPVGVVELNRNPANHFEEVEQAAFSPANLVPGIGLSPDKMLQARLFADGDAERHRLGANYHQLPVNRPHNPVVNHQRDGAMRHALVEPHRILDPPIPANGHGARYQNPEPDDHRQAGALYRLLDPAARHRLVENLVAAMQGVPEPIQRRQVLHFTQADQEYGAAVAAGLRLDMDGGARVRPSPQETGMAPAGTSA